MHITLKSTSCMLKIFTIHISCTKTNLIFTNVYREMLAMWRSSSSMAAVAPTGEREREREIRERQKRDRERQRDTYRLNGRRTKGEWRPRF
jgi:hypothetical protein